MSQLDTAIRHQIHIERLKTHEAKKLIDAIERSTAAIVSLIRKLDVDSLSELRRAELTELLREAKKRQQKIIGEAVRRHEKKLIEIAGYEAEFERKSINAAAGVGSAAAIAADIAYREALRHPIKATGQMLESFISDWTKKEIASVEGAIRTAYSEGKSINETVAAIRGTRGARYKDGLMQVAKRHANAIVRTATQHVVSRARQAVWAKSPHIIDRYIWVSTLDTRTSDICQGLSGQIFPVGKGPQPPAHVNCRSRTVALIKNDPPPDMPTYYEWLKKQPLSVQVDVLGESRAKLFRDGGMSAEQFRKFNIGRDLKAMTLDELRGRESDAFKRAGL